MTFRLYPGDPSIRPRGKSGGRRNAVLNHGYVVSGELVTTGDVAARLGVSRGIAVNRLRRAKHPVTWDALQATVRGKEAR